MKKLITAALTLAILTACGGGNDSAPKPPELTPITPIPVIPLEPSQPITEPWTPLEPSEPATSNIYVRFWNSSGYIDFAEVRMSEKHYDAGVRQVSLYNRPVCDKEPQWFERLECIINFVPLDYTDITPEEIKYAERGNLVRYTMPKGYQLELPIYWVEGTYASSTFYAYLYEPELNPDNEEQAYKCFDVFKEEFTEVVTVIHEPTLDVLCE